MLPRGRSLAWGGPALRLGRLEQVRERPAHGQVLGAALDLDGRLPPKVPRHVFNRRCIHDGGAVNLPEFVGVESGQDVLDGRANQSVQFACGQPAPLLATPTSNSGSDQSVTQV